MEILKGKRVIESWAFHVWVGILNDWEVNKRRSQNFWPMKNVDLFLMSWKTRTG